QPRREGHIRQMQKGTQPLPGRLFGNSRANVGSLLLYHIRLFIGIGGHGSVCTEFLTRYLISLFAVRTRLSCMTCRSLLPECFRFPECAFLPARLTTPLHSAGCYPE